MKPRTCLRIGCYYLHCLLACFAVPAALAQDFTQLGGGMTSTFTGRQAIQLPGAAVTSQDRINLQLSGFSVFHQLFSRRTGLGPNFVHISCGSCHVDNGRGRVTLLPSIEGGTSMVIKVALKGLSDSGAPRDVPGVGEQLQEHSVNGKNRFDARLRWRRVTGRYGDGSRYVLRKPDLNFVIAGYPRRQIAYSLRMTPAVIGPGLLEAIPAQEILSRADSGDANGDGISGKPQYVPDRRTGTFALGRFGFKASHTTLEQQTAAAAFHDIGITNALFNPDSGSQELGDDELTRLVAYLALAGVPAARSQEDPDVIRGKELFQNIGCDDCHVSTIRTESSLDPELNGHEIHPFTDLLLHDMGPGLADARAEYSASGREWRTTPLWGLGYSETLSKVRARFLHDGRARSIEEAILWHGGEAEKSRNEFKKLPRADRQSILKFLKSL